MKKLILLCVIGSFVSYASSAYRAEKDQSKESVYKLLLHFPPLLKAYTCDPRLTKVTLEGLRNDYEFSELLPHLTALTTYNFRGDKKKADQEALIELYKKSQSNPDLKPFFKQAYHHLKKENSLPVHAQLPDQATINSYPDSFNGCKSKEAILEPLLNNKEKITRREYNHQVEKHDRALAQKVEFFGRNTSEILFPGLADVLLTLQSFVPNIETIVTETVLEKARTLNKKRDRTILEKFWNQSLTDPELFPFIEKGYANFVEAYGDKPSLESIHLKKEACTLGDYCAKHPKSRQAHFYHKLAYPKKSATQKSSFLVKALIGSTALVGAYLIYKKCKGSQSNETLNSKLA